eukprot:maker-scaffold_7-snap-gene-9.7-mRNA-1 protein AED:0.64 eAED:0.66 QI:0/0/0/1/0/0/2/0/460
MLKTCCLSIERQYEKKNSKNNSALIVNKFNILPHITSLTTDNATEMISTAKEVRNLIKKDIEDNSMVGSAPRRDFHVRCLAHVINLFTKAVLKPLKKYVQEAREYILFFKNAGERQRIRGKLCEDLNIPKKHVTFPPLDSETRWDSQHFMLKGFIERESSLLRINMNLPEDDESLAAFDRKYNCKRLVQDYKAVALKKNSFVRFGVIVSILDDLPWMTKLCSSETSVTISARMLIFNKIREKFLETKNMLQYFVLESSRVENIEKYGEEFVDFMVKVKTGVDNVVDTYLQKYTDVVEQARIFKIASLLDKRCKLSAPRESDEFKDVVEEVVLEMDKAKSLDDDVPVTQVLKKSKLDFSLLFEDVQSSRTVRNIEPSRGELLRYLDVDGVAGNVDILAWWKNAEQRFPTVAKVARKFFAIQTSSVSSERAFSHGRFEYRGKENMSDETFMMRMNAREWMKL